MTECGKCPKNMNAYPRMYTKITFIQTNGSLSNTLNHVFLLKPMKCTNQNRDAFLLNTQTSQVALHEAWLRSGRKSVSIYLFYETQWNQFKTYPRFPSGNWKKTDKTSKFRQQKIKTYTAYFAWFVQAVKTHFRAIMMWLAQFKTSFVWQQNVANLCKN